MSNLKPILQKQFLVTIQGLGEVLFNTVSAPKEAREQSDYSDGSTGIIRKVSGFTQYDNVTLGKNYNPVQDKAIWTWYQAIKKPDAQPFSVTIQPVHADAAGTPITGGGTLILLNCEVVSLTMPAVDREANGTAKIMVELSFDDLSFS